MIRGMTQALLVGLFAVGLGCGPQQESSQLPEALSGQLVTLTNLHPDEGQGRLWSLNYQQSGLLPMCTPITVEQFDEAKLVFSVAQTGRSYEYYFHDSMARSHADHLSMYFGRECTPPDPDAYTDAELSAISAGKVEEGMSKAAVVYSLGYPPGHRTPSLQMDSWSYWKSKHNRIAVEFDEDRVVSIRD